MVSICPLSLGPSEMAQSNVVGLMVTFSRRVLNF
jgi:hypothetical protein